MKWLTEDARLLCQHRLGLVKLVPTQSLVTIQGRSVLVETDPEGRPIAGCPNYGPTIKPCTATLRVQHGYSDLLRIQGRRVCLDTVSGLTDGTPPGTVPYQVQEPGQQLVSQTL
jgi:hypothetical protein